MEQSVVSFYDDLSDHYHLLYENWGQEVQRQGRWFDQFFNKLLPNGATDVLDATCGIGTQALGLAAAGYKVVASDLSPRAIARAQSEALALDLNLQTYVADLRNLESVIRDRFDAVLACDNALSHLFSDDDLLAAMRQLHGRLRPGGLLVASIRDYDRLVEPRALAAPGIQQLPGEYEVDGTGRPKATMPRVFGDDHDRRIVFQVWDWAADGKSYAINQFFVCSEGTSWRTIQHTTRFRALLRRDVTACLEATGFGSIRWHEPTDSGFYQPIVTAVR